jgi:predicted NUDIX family phosphoesterase
MHKSLDEQILVVKRPLLLGTTSWQGLKKENLDHYLSIIQNHQEFLPRAAMEVDPTYKQIIPYLIFKYQDRYFLMQRSANASEQRLQNKFSLGIGGHIRKEDMIGKTIFDWAQREFYEEVSYQGALTIEPLGVLNDDSNDVGKVHIGLVLLLQGDSDNIHIKSELKSGRLVTLEECKEKSDLLETWSHSVLNYLLSQ